MSVSSADYDVIVIGSGFGGSVSALRLSEKGYRVGVLEKGARWRPEDYPPNNWHLRKWMWRPRLGLIGPQQLTILKDTFIMSAVGVGGGSLIYGNTLYEPLDQFFLRQALGAADLDQGCDLRRHQAERDECIAQPVGNQPRQLRCVKADRVALVEAHKVLCS